MSMLAWYGSQSETAVYRCLWLGIIFRQPFFPLSSVGSCLQLGAYVHTSSFTFRLVVCCFEFQFIKNMWNSIHGAPWSHSYDERDNSNNLTSLSLSHFATTLEVSLSIWKTHLWPSFNFNWCLEMLLQFSHIIIFRPHDAIYFVKCTSPSCSKATPQYDAATPVLPGWSLWSLWPNRPKDIPPKSTIFVPMCSCKP